MLAACDTAGLQITSQRITISDFNSDVLIEIAIRSGVSYFMAVAQLCSAGDF